MKEKTIIKSLIEISILNKKIFLEREREKYN
jgi:hypothetical protein